MFQENRIFIQFGYNYLVVNCLEPVLSRGVGISSSLPASTLVGDEIMYKCREGFQPADTVVTSLCGADGLWRPNTILHTCTG